MVPTSCANDQLVIGGRPFRSRLFTGTGKYPDLTTMQQSIEHSGCEMVTVAVRRVQAVAAGHAGLMDAIDWTRIWMLPNTTPPAAAMPTKRCGWHGWAVNWRSWPARRTTTS